MPARAQVVSWDNVHINVMDPAKAAEWYTKYLGATPVGVPGQATQVQFGKVLVVFLKGQEPQKSADSLIDHIGLSDADITQQVKNVQDGGAKVLTAPRDIPGVFRFGFVEDPFGIKIELVEDPGLQGFHHVHLRVPDPATTLRWYEDMFGGDRAKLKGRIEGLRYGGVWLLADKGSGNTLNQQAPFSTLGFWSRISISKLQPCKLRASNSASNLARSGVFGMRSLRIVTDRALK